MNQQHHNPSANTDSLRADEAFLDSLAQGKDPSGGRDELAQLLLQLREDTRAPMPEPPQLPEEEERSSVIDIKARRHHGRFTQHLASGLIGAAAATLAIAGFGALLYNAEPGTPLWGLSSKVFDERATVVELAGTLDDMDAAVDRGEDPAALRAILTKARISLEHKQEQAEHRESEPAEKTVTVTVPAPAPAPETQTEVVTETVTETVPPSPVSEPESVEEEPTSQSQAEPTPPVEHKASAPMVTPTPHPEPQN